jgi:hypothetical protein
MSDINVSYYIKEDNSFTLVDHTFNGTHVPNVGQHLLNTTRDSIFIVDTVVFDDLLAFVLVSKIDNPSDFIRFILDNKYEPKFGDATY